MAKFILSDIFIGDYKRTQGWGSRPDVYAQFGQAGHNGWDFVMPNGTQIVSPCDGECLGSYEQRDSNGNLSGFGRYCKVLHEQNGEFFVTVYAHLQSVEVSKGQKIKKFQLIAKSDNNGFSEAPHLHFGVYLSDAQGNKIETNNFGGYHNPGDKTLFEWKIENPAKPYEPTVEETLGITPDAKRALDALEKFRVDQKHGNLEGAMNALLGAFKDLENLQKETGEIRKQVDELKSELRDRDTFISGQKETVGALQKQQLEMADLLQVSSDYPTIKGEVQKLIAVEDDNIMLRSQIKTLKDSQGNEVGKLVAEWERKNKDLQKQIDDLQKENTVLKAKRVVDRFSDGEKIWIGVTALFKRFGGFFKDIFVGLGKGITLPFRVFFKRGGDKKNE